MQQPTREYALLSMASVTFGDAVSESNRTLLMRLCREDTGMLLKGRPPCNCDRRPVPSDDV